MRVKLLILLILSIFLSSCVTDEQFQRTQNNIYYLGSTTSKLQMRTTQLEKRVSKLEEKVDRLESKILAEQKLKFNEIYTELATIKNQLKDQAYLEKKLSRSGDQGSTEVTQEAIKDIYTKLYNLENQISSLQKGSENKNIPQVVKDDRYFYKNAYSLFTAGKYDKAEKAFTEFINKFPKSRLIPNAYYWLGETFFKRKMYEKAIINYDEVIVKYPKSPKVPAALLKQGISFMRIGEKDGAKLIFKKILKDYPRSPQAMYAKNYLKNLK